MSRKPLVAANWKMNGRLAMAEKLSAAIVAAVPDSIEVIVCPPTCYLLPVARQLNASVALGGQDLAVQQEGAVTGAVSAEMLLDCDVRYVLVGHSERRSLFTEDDDMVAAKFLRASDAGLIPVLCVGESLDERQNNKTESVIARQLEAVIARTGIRAMAKAVVAYEPVWAIGTGKTATPEQAQQVHAFIRQYLADQSPDIAEGLRILYGGSVNADNAASLFARPDVDGGLVGGASLDADSFLAICQAATAQ